MKLLFTGHGHAGSWVVRGEQLGAACGAVVKSQATLADCKAADLIVVVKRVPNSLLAAIRASGRPWVWDVVDAYPQPEVSGWDRDRAVRWVRERVKFLAPTAMIWPNQRMQDDCQLSGLVLRHHHRPGIGHNPIREQVCWVGYDGRSCYLGPWRERVENECWRRRWRFVETDRLQSVDIAVSFRGGAWNGYAPRNWKSNVKLANAHGSGTPWVGQRECGYLETGTGAEHWAEDEASLAKAFDMLTPQAARAQVRESFRAAAYPVQKAAADLGAFLAGL